MTIVLTLLIGLIVGALAKIFLPGRDPGGVLITILLGIAGAFLAGWLGRAAGLYPESPAGPGLIASVLGAMLLLFVHRLVVTRSPLGNR